MLADLRQRGDANRGEVVEPQGQVLEFGPERVRVQWGAERLRQNGHVRMQRGQPCHQVLAGDLPPAGVDDGGEVQDLAVCAHHHRGVGEAGQVPDILVEDRAGAAGLAPQAGGLDDWQTVEGAPPGKGREEAWAVVTEAVPPGAAARRWRSRRSAGWRPQWRPGRTGAGRPRPGGPCMDRRSAGTARWSSAGPAGRSTP